MKIDLGMGDWMGSEMASTSRIVLEETLARLTSDPRVRSDDPLLVSLRRQLEDLEVQERQLQDDRQSSFDSIFEILDDCPNGEECAKAYLAHKQQQRLTAAARTKEAEQDRLSQAKAQLMGLLSRIRDNQSPGAYPRDLDARKGQQLKVELALLLQTLNTRDGPVCADCGRIIQLRIRPDHFDVDVETHGYWTNPTDTEYRFTPSEYRRCSRA